MNFEVEELFHLASFYTELVWNDLALLADAENQRDAQILLFFILQNQQRVASSMNVLVSFALEQPGSDELVREEWRVQRELFLADLEWFEAHNA
uniref:Uncharacterized protein n=1 Tax=Caenorhabditis japonica TaxID=281687 RepID=A0A8R1ISS4_CAEJA